MAELKMPDTLIKCDICRREFSLTKDCLSESKITLEKAGLDPKEVVLTVMECPCCGKSYPVTMDDAECLELVKDLTELHQHLIARYSKYNRVPPKMQKKYHAMEVKLGFKRKKLADEYTGSFYQSAEGKQQLDYRYHVR